jgi:hypothetical protein
VIETLAPFARNFFSFLMARLISKLYQVDSHRKAWEMQGEF